MNIKSTVTLKHFVKEYNRLNGADKYIVAFPFNNEIHYVVVNHLKMNWLKLSREAKSKGGHQKVKLYASLKELATMNHFYLCDKETFEEWTKFYHNKGNAIEKIIADVNGMDFTPNSFPFYRGGDIEIDGVSYQLKWYEASLTNIVTLHNAQKWYRENKRA